jgi:hypothetical protein
MLYFIKKLKEKKQTDLQQKQLENNERQLGTGIQ